MPHLLIKGMLDFNNGMRGGIFLLKSLKATGLIGPIMLTLYLKKLVLMWSQRWLDVSSVVSLCYALLALIWCSWACFCQFCRTIFSCTLHLHRKLHWISSGFHYPDYILSSSFLYRDAAIFYEHRDNVFLLQSLFLHAKCTAQVICLFLSLSLIARFTVMAIRNLHSLLTGYRLYSRKFHSEGCKWFAILLLEALTLDIWSPLQCLCHRRRIADASFFKTNSMTTVFS